MISCLNITFNFLLTLKSNLKQFNRLFSRWFCVQLDAEKKYQFIVDFSEFVSRLELPALVIVLRMFEFVNDGSHVFPLLLSRLCIRWFTIQSSSPPLYHHCRLWLSVDREQWSSFNVQLSLFFDELGCLSMI